MCVTFHWLINRLHSDTSSFDKNKNVCGVCTRIGIRVNAQTNISLAWWVCYRVFGLFRTFHTHTTMLNARPTIFSFGVLGLFSSFGFVSNIPYLRHDFH